LSGTYSIASDVSADGSIIVGETRASGLDPSKATVWCGGKPNDLELLLTRRGVTPTRELDHATAISDDGQTIVGYGGQTSRHYSFVAKITLETFGDVTGDCAVDITDLLWLQQALNGERTLDSGETERANVSDKGVGLINISDLLVLEAIVNGQ